MKTRRLRVCTTIVLGSGALLLTLFEPQLSGIAQVPVIPGSASGDRETRQAFDAYRGDNTDVVEGLLKKESLLTVFDGLVAIQSSWASPDTDSRSRLALATFALEVAHEAPKRTPSPDVRFLEGDVLDRVRLVEFAGAVLAGKYFDLATAGGLSLAKLPDSSAAPAGQIEEYWFDAALSLLRMNWSAGLIALPPGFSHNVTYPLVELGYRRLPGNMAIAFAETVAQEHFGWAAHHAAPGLPLNAAKMPGAVDMNGLLAGPRLQVSVDEEGLRRTAHKGYEKFVDTSFGPTARLRDGFLYLLSFQHGQARRRFSEVLAAESAGPRERFLANLFAGWSWETQGDLQRAEPQYRAALQLVPNARSASVLLASLLARGDHFRDAQELRAALLTDPDDPEDPWSTYYFDGGVPWQQAIGRLRAALRDLWR